MAPGLVAIGMEHPQSIPDGYFEALPMVILSRIRGEESLRLPMAPTQPEVPAGYFDGLAAKVLGKVGRMPLNEVQDETYNLAPILSRIGNKMPQAVPEGYFEGLAEDLVTRNKKPAPVFSIRSVRVVRFAAAAAVVGLLFTGAWLLIRDGQRVTDQPAMASGQSRPDSVPESALANYLDQTQALDDLAADLPETAKNEDMALLNLDDQKVGELLSTMTDKEIADYMTSDPNGGPNVMKN